MQGAPGTRRRLVVIGNGMAGSRLLGEIGHRAPGRFEIAVFGAEPVPAYNRILLSAVLAGDKKLREIRLRRPCPAAEPVDVSIDEPVIAVDLRRRQICTAVGRTVSYDALVFATGSSPIVLPVPGAALPGVMTLRDAADVEGMIADAAPGRRAVVIGGGLLGLEAAQGLSRRGMAVTLVHLMPWLMERQLDARAGAMLQASLEGRGISFVLPAETAEILGAGRAQSVRLKDGRVLPADLVAMAVGIKPNAGLARAAGLACGRGIAVDDAMRTSHPGVYAVGECAEHRGRSYGLVAPLWEQVDVCAAQLAGDASARYTGSLQATTLKVTGIDVYSAGELSADDGDEITLCDAGRGVYRKLVLCDGRLRGAVLYGDASDGAWYFDLMRSARPIDAMREELVFGKAFAASRTPAAVHPES